MLIADSHEFLEFYRGDKDVRLAAEMVRCGDGVRVVSFGPDRLSPNDRAISGKTKVADIGLPELPDGMDLVLLPSVALRFAQKESGGVIALMFGYGRALAGARPDVIMENPYSWLTPRSYVTYLVSVRLGIPVVYYDAGDDIPISRRHQVMATWERPIIHHAFRIITYTEAGRARFIRKYGYPTERIRVIPKPIAVAAFAGRGGGAAWRRSWGVADDATLVSYIGRLAEYKGSAVLLDVARRAVCDPALAGCVFAFIGGAIGSSQNEKAYRRENTLVTGMLEREEVIKAISASDVVVFPDVSRPAGFPTAAAEAMAAGKALVVGASPGCGGLPVRDGMEAMVVEPGDPEAIAAALRRLVADPPLRLTLGAAAGRYAREEMDYPKVAAVYLEVLREVLEEAKGRGAADGR